ncbi:hypothetical protein Slin15195_G018580 [Septoria linicola]|uniref:Uncharacterized protein n=1 Tax=Septoria linicola TaxID=215465 RepID=A0A9Q9EG43_9PEZI|nr:hypothetical protein Slin15195_G018580 [Septoria linicola]
MKQQTASSKPQEAPGDEDSGYASTQAETLETILSPSLNPPTLPSVNVKITYKQVQPASRTFHVDTWQLEGERPRSEPAERRIMPETSMPRDPTEQGQGISQGLLGGVHPSAGWPDGQERGFLWHEPRRDQALRPVSTSQLPIMPTHDATSRRQSIAFPLPAHDNTFEQQRDPFAGGGGAYDDIATLLYARMGMEPDTNAFHGLWDVNTHITGSLAQQVPYTQTQGQRPLHPETNPQSLNDVFGHWPNWPNE